MLWYKICILFALERVQALISDTFETSEIILTRQLIKFLRWKNLLWFIHFLCDPVLIKICFLSMVPSGLSHCTTNRKNCLVSAKFFVYRVTRTASKIQSKPTDSSFVCVLVLCNFCLPVPCDCRVALFILSLKCTDVKMCEKFLVRKRLREGRRHRCFCCLCFILTSTLLSSIQLNPHFNF